MSKGKKGKSLLDLITAENIQEVNSDKEGLEESMKRFNEVAEFLFATNEVLKVLNEKDKTISDLEAKLAESEKRCNSAFNSGHSFRLTEVDIQLNILKKEITAKEKAITKLKQQLAEKEEEIEELEQEKEYIRKHKLMFENALVDISKANQDKISFAVSKLEKVSDWIIQHRVKPFFEERYIVYTKSLQHMIQEEIEQLKEGK